MKLTVLQEDLVKALNSTARIVTTKAQMPVLSHLKIEAQQDGLLIYATDLELGLRFRIPAQVETPGSLTTPARVIHELITNCGPGTLTLVAENNQLKISGGGIKASLTGMPTDEFPQLPDLNTDTAAQLPVEDLVSAINKVSFAAATDDSRPVLTAMQLTAVDGRLELAATDGFRLSWASFPLPPLPESSQTQWLIPAKALQEIVRLVSPSDTTIRFGLTENQSQIMFLVGDILLVSRLVSGTFPDFKKIIPPSGDTFVELDRQELLRAIRLAAIFARESANIVKFTVQESQLLITANAPQVGDQESSVDVSVKGPPAQIAFNYRYVLDYLNISTSSTIILQMTNSLGPGLWLEKGNSDQSTPAHLSYKHVIMPVRLESGE